MKSKHRKNLIDQEIQAVTNMCRSLTSDLCPASLLTKSSWARISRWRIVLSRLPEDNMDELQARAPIRNRWPSIVRTLLQRDASQIYIEGGERHQLKVKLVNTACHMSILDYSSWRKIDNHLLFYFILFYFLISSRSSFIFILDIWESQKRIFQI